MDDWLRPSRKNWKVSLHRHLLKTVLKDRRDVCEDEGSVVACSFRLALQRHIIFASARTSHATRIFLIQENKTEKADYCRFRAKVYSDEYAPFV